MSFLYFYTPVRLSTTMRWYPNCVLMGPTTSPKAVSGEKTTSSNSLTMVPGAKLPSDPAEDLPDGHVEYSRARVPKFELPEPIWSMISFASSLDFTRMCLADARTPSGGDEY